MRARELTENRIDSPEFHALLTPAVRKVNQVFVANGFEIRIVGGAVRDLILGKAPKDTDMATTATPEQAMHLLQEIGVRVEPTGIQHGTITAIIDDQPIEITTLRVDTETDGRHAKVAFTTDWQLDAERRDLTYNAMSLDLQGNLFDYFGGLADLQNGVTRFVGSADQRIQEDYLRILRYFRFIGRQPTVNWDDATIQAIHNNAKGLHQISGERIWAEFSKILVGNHVEDIVEQMRATGVASACGINVSSDSVAKLGRLHQQGIKDPRIMLASLLSSTNESVSSLRKRWKFDNATLGW